VRVEGTTIRPSETAFVLAALPGEVWRCLGVGRSSEPGVLRVPEVDCETWGTWGEGRQVWRRLPEGALARAQVMVDAILALPAERRGLRRANGQEAQVLGAAASGGLRIDGSSGGGGGSHGFEARTVSSLDLAWAMLAHDDVAANGGLVDEARVNKLRYLEGTPKGSTRWIDTGWAIAAWALGRGLEVARIATDAELHRIRRDDGTVVDASFRIERAGDAVEIVFEAGGGTRGTAAARNTEYAAGLELVLRRLGEAGLALSDVLVDTRDTRSLTPEERRVVLASGAYPVVIADAAALRREISAGQKRVGRAPGAKGSGNQTRRLRLGVVGLGGVAAGMTAEGLGRLVRGGA
jgi:hypothetical protein